MLSATTADLRPSLQHLDHLGLQDLLRLKRFDPGAQGGFVLRLLCLSHLVPQARVAQEVLGALHGQLRTHQLHQVMHKVVRQLVQLRGLLVICQVGLLSSLQMQVSVVPKPIHESISYRRFDQGVVLQYNLGSQAYLRRD